jgi:DNA-binding MarR family transcriptional regulator
VADHDKREVWVRLTPAGRVILRKLALAHRMELEKSGPELASALNSVLRLTRSNQGL